MSSEISSDGLKSPSGVFAPFDSVTGFDGAGLEASVAGLEASVFGGGSAAGGGSLTGALGGVVVSAAVANMQTSKDSRIGIRRRLIHHSANRAIRKPRSGRPSVP